MSLWLPEDDVLAQDSELLKQSLERYRRLLSGNGYAFWEWGLHDGSYRCGGRFWSALGYDVVDESVTSVDSVQKYVHPDDFNMLQDVVLDHLRFDTPVDVVYRIKAKDGNYWWTQACASSTRDEDGRVTYLSGVNFDLSHLKETEKALRLSEARHERILAGSNDGIWEWSQDAKNKHGRFHTSHSCWRHLGYSEQEVDFLPEYERLTIWRSHIHPDDLPKMYRALKQHFVLKKPFDIEYRMFSKQSQVFWVRSRGQAIFNGQGRAILMSGINIDVTELKQAQERARQAKEEAEKANAAKSHFLSSMSHELRTPLNAIMGFSQLSINDAALNPTQREQAQQIYSAGEHLLHLIDDVLDLAQIEAGAIPICLEPVSVPELIDECLALVAAMAAQKSITFHVDKQNYKQYYVNADIKRLKQCLLNLINNAIKYNKEGGEVWITLQQVAPSLAIHIEDTGPGIPKEKQAQLFQPFNRLGFESSTVEGTGIGLVITKELIEKMQGSLHYLDTKTGGACFCVELPLISAAVTESPVKADDMYQGLEKTLTVANSTVIYIEDNLPSTAVMKALLTPHPEITLHCYDEPIRGLYHIRSSTPDLILLDINLPNISGFDFLSILKADQSTKHIPVIALSASAMPYNIEKGQQSGFNEYLTKPINIQQLIAVLNQYLPKAS